MPRFLVASLLVLAASACGEIKTNHLADAPAGSNADASTIDGAPSAGRVTIKVLDNSGSGAPLVGGTVLFTDGAGTQRVATDANGSAAAAVLDGATITAIAGEDGGVFLQTLYGVKSTDQILLGDGSVDTNLGSFTVTFNPIAGLVASYVVFGPCGSAGATTNPTNGITSAVLGMSSQCKTDPMELVITASDSSGSLIASIDKTGVPFVQNGSTVITTAFQPELAFAASYTDAGSASSVTLARLAPDDNGVRSSIAGAIAGGLVSLTVTGPATSTAVVQSTISRPTFGQQEVQQRVDGNATTYGLDISSTVLPWLGTATYDATTQTIDVPVATDGSSNDAPDFFFCTLQYTPKPGPDAGPAVEHSWLLIAAAPQNLVLPALPADLAGLAPTAGDTVNVDCGAFETDAIAGYDVARQDIYHVADALSNPRNITGTARQSESVVVRLPDE